MLPTTVRQKFDQPASQSKFGKGLLSLRQRIYS